MNKTLTSTNLTVPKKRAISDFKGKKPPFLKKGKDEAPAKGGKGKQEKTCPDCKKPMSKCKCKGKGSY